MNVDKIWKVTTNVEVTLYIKASAAADAKLKGGVITAMVTASSGLFVSLRSDK
ncbi:unnamed protein product [marine sediment metagenome]|uniref:Uncharacterized protein n=1 Tax=marine sediment metagenome TaxID=412755 RepID=X1CJ66_9ZZZZ